jgi:tetratricopeptide (TPR) repeat protein
VDQLYAISTALFDNKEYARTAQVLEKIRSIRPKHPDALFRLAACYYALGEPRKVIQAGEYYLKSAGDEIDCAIYRLLGFSYAETGQKAKAYECAVQIVMAMERTQKGEDYALLSRLAAQVLAAAEDRPEAIRVLEDATRRAPKDPEVLLDLAVLYEEEKSDDKAEETLRSVLQRDPGNHRALNHLGYFYAERGRKLDEAVSLIRDALKAEPKNWAYMDSFGWACFKLGRYQEALEKLQEAITIQDDPVLREHLGSVFEATGNKEKAREHWLRALELDPKRENLRGRIDKLNETAGQASP